MGNLGEIALRMRRDWDARAASDAEHYVYTRDGAGDEADFAASGRANYDQLVRPYLPVLLEGRPARDCRVLEIGCGVGRMTAAFAAAFGAVDAVDVSPEMLARARRRLAGCPNVKLHAGSGHDLAFLPDACCDLVFSYIVFQHIPSRDVIENYVREAARVLRPRGVLKFQLNGDQSPAYRAHQPDTWMGVAFSLPEARALLESAGLALLAAEGAGTQYFVLTARKSPPEPDGGPRPYCWPGAPWAEPQLLSGWGDAVDQSWRPLLSPARVRLAPGGPRVYFAAWFWPEEPFRPRTVSINGGPPVVVEGPGDHFLEFDLDASSPEVLTVAVDPSARAPAVRAIGRYGTV